MLVWPFNSHKRGGRCIITKIPPRDKVPARIFSTAQTFSPLWRSSGTPRQPISRRACQALSRRGFGLGMRPGQPLTRRVLLCSSECCKRIARQPITPFAQEHSFSSCSQFVAINQTCRATMSGGGSQFRIAIKRPRPPRCLLLFLTH